VLNGNAAGQRSPSSESGSAADPPTRSLGPVARWILRAPTALYGAGLGWVLGHRFLMLTHRGRRTGRLHRTVLEVLQWDPAAQEAVVMVAFGKRAQWYRNVADGGGVEVAIDRKCWRPELRRLGVDEAASVLAGYERRNRLIAPIVRRVLSRLAGFRYDGSDSARRKLAETLPIVALRRADDAGVS
jgi:deazaflavin-dependent oxidoreductase (nitroreductase family)